MTTTHLPLVEGRAVGDEHDHPPQPADHFATMRQEYEACKLGMWLFLATEVLLFGGLFCAYAVFRGNHPDLFAWGSQFLDVKFGAVNTVVLIFSSLTMASAVTLVQLNRRWPVIVALGLTFLCGVIFMAVKSVEYEHKFHENLVWGLKFYDAPHGAETDGESALAAARVADPARGHQLWGATCRSCHGLAGEGVTGQGKDIRNSEFIQVRDDSELVAFIQVGRMPSDPLNTTGIQMPPRGGNPMLKEDDLFDIVAYVRSFMLPGSSDETDGGTPPEAEQAGDTTTPAEAPEQAAADTAPQDGADEAFWIPKSSIPLAPPGPAGVDLAALAAMENHEPLDGESASPTRHMNDPDRPDNAHVFFAFYFGLTGLHALHVLAGMGLIAWLMIRTTLGHFSSGYFTPVDIGGLYWHIVDLIWIFLFPLFYLIG